MSFEPERATFRIIEAMLFASVTPLSEDDLRERLPEPDVDLAAELDAITRHYENRGVNLVKVGGGWMFRTAPDLAFLLRREVTEARRLSRAAIETLAIIAYHQPVTRAEIEEIRGVSLGRGTLDILMEAEWIRPMGRRRTPGRPVTYGTSDEFLVQFGLSSTEDLPGFDELKAAGLLDPIEKALDQLERQVAENPVLPGLESEDGAEQTDGDADENLRGEDSSENMSEAPDRDDFRPA